MLRPQPKRKRYENKKILKACKDPDNQCLVQLPGCQTSPTIPAHSNLADDGKGKGIKADDCFVAIACQNCHDVLDRRKPEYQITREVVQWYHDRAIKRTIRRMIDMGVPF